MPGAIMLASIFFVTLIEMVFSPARHVCGGNDGVDAVSRKPQKPKNNTQVQDLALTPRNEMRRTYSDASLRVRDIGILRGRMGSISRTLSRYREDGQRLDAIESVRSESAAMDEADEHENKEPATEDDIEDNQHSHILSPEQVHKKAIMQVFLLEMGILFHSIFIGMSLAVAVGNDFTVLLIAIIFHRKSVSDSLCTISLRLLQKPLKALRSASVSPISNGSPELCNPGSWLLRMAARKFVFLES